MDALGPDEQAAAAVEGAGAPPELPLGFFRGVVEAANEGVWIVDTDAVNIFANEQMAQLLGTTADAMMGQSAFQYLFPADHDRAREIMAQTYAGNPQQFEIDLRRADGSAVPALGGSSAIRDDQGRVTGAVAMFSDLTDRKAAEQAIIESEHEATRAATLLRELLESATDPIWMRDADGAFRVVNGAAASVMGRAPEDVIGADIHEIWPPVVAKSLEEQSEALFQSGVSRGYEEAMFDASKGEWRTYLSTKVPLFAGDGSRIGILGISRDITDRKLAEDSLRASEARLAAQVEELNALYASAPIGLAFFSRDYRYLRINDELAAINGVPAPLHIGRTIREVLSDSAPAVEPVIDRVFQTGETIRDIEVTGETPQQPGVPRHWLAGFYPVKGADGAVEAVGAWVIEITERKAAEQRELLLAREIDHRAKNLLAVVQSIVQLTPTEDVDQLKTSIVGRIQALAGAHKLLSDSRWDGVDLGRLVEEELAPFVTRDGRVRQGGAPIRLRPAAAQSLALVLHELATNAAKYGALSHPTGTLDVEWRRIETADVSQLELLWLERGVAVRPPEQLGFGSNIIRTSVERQLRGKVSKEWTSNGLTCTLLIPAAELLPGTEP